MSKSLQQLGYCEKALSLKNEIEENFLLFAEYLYNIKEHQMYAPQWSSFEEFVEELKMSVSSINRFIQMHKKFVLEYGFSSEEILRAGAYSSLNDIMPVIGSKKDAIHWMQQSATLTRQHLREELIEAKKGVLMQSCSHAETYQVEICRNCGERKQIL